MSSLIYRVISEWNVGGELDDSIVLKPGTILFALSQPDYGTAWLHTPIDGEPYVSVTADEKGGYSPMCISAPHTISKAAKVIRRRNQGPHHFKDLVDADAYLTIIAERSITPRLNKNTRFEAQTARLETLDRRFWSTRGPGRAKWRGQ